MVSVAVSVRRNLRQAGLSARAIDAVWPAWWSVEAEGSVSATTELRYTLARRLGLSPASLFDGPPKFIWRDEAKFKGLGTESEQERAALTSFGVAVARCVAQGMPQERSVSPISPLDLRSAILETSTYVDLDTLIAYCWAFGIGVLFLTVFPLSQKRMHAMTVRSGDRYVILLGRTSRFPAQVTYVIAHELAHLLLGHVSESSALLEMNDLLTGSGADQDREEQAADRFALALLTGTEEPDVQSNQERFSGAQLAEAAMRYGPELHIEPATLALCLGYTTKRWAQSVRALKLIPPGEMDVRSYINQIARAQLNWQSFSFESLEFVDRLLGEESAA